MNKEQLIIILQATLFNFDGLTAQEIIKLNPDYNSKLVSIGIQLNKYLKEQLK